MTDELGAIAGWAEYDVWGLVADTVPVQSGQHLTDLVQGFTGYRFDPLLSVYFAQARMYDLVNKRFMAPDPVKGCICDPISMVQYVYCANNPVRFSDPSGLKAQSVNHYSGGYSLYVSPLWLDAGQSGAGLGLGYLNPIAGAFYSGATAIALRLAGYREIGYKISSDALSVAAGLTEGLANNPFVKSLGKWAGVAIDAVDIGIYAYDWFKGHKYQIEEAISNQFDSKIWISDTRNLVDRKFSYAMSNMSYMIVSGKVEVRKAIDVYDKSAFSDWGGSLGMCTWQYDPLTGKNRIFSQNDYYFFLLGCATPGNTISDLEKTIKQGVWLD